MALRGNTRSPPLLRVSVVTFPYQLHNLNTRIRNYNHAHILVCSSPYVYDNILPQTCQHFWLSTHHTLVNNLRKSIHPPTHSHTHTHTYTHTHIHTQTHSLTHTHTLPSLIHRYIHSRSRTDVGSTNSALLIRTERLRNVGQNRN